MDAEDDVGQKIERFSAMAQAEPENPLHHFALAQLLVREEEWERAAGSYRHCLELNPGWMMAAIGLSRCLIEMESWDEARDSLHLGSALATKQGHDEPFEEIRELLDRIPDL